jgi:hypothetical protein
MFFINPEIASAFQDIYEPDDSLEQARLTIIGDKACQQHTLHSLTDEDGFKFSAMAGYLYRIKASPVDIDIDIAIALYDSDGNCLLEEAIDDGVEGEYEFFSWTAPSDGFYYVKVTNLHQSDNCRINIQYELQLYELQLFDPDAPTLDGKVKGLVTDAISGRPLNKNFFS